MEPSAPAHPAAHLLSAHPELFSEAPALTQGHLQALERAQSRLEELEAAGTRFQEAVFALASHLRDAGCSPEASAWALTQIELRRHAVKARKFGATAGGLVYTRAGLEQASRSEMGLFHARLMSSDRPPSPGALAVDAGCGLGADSLAFLDAGFHVLALEIDPETAAHTACNLAQHPHGQRALVLVCDVLALLSSGLLESDPVLSEAALWFDPARREGGPQGRARVFDPEEFSPPLSAIEQAASANPARWVCAKLGPALQEKSVPERFDTWWITQGNETSEAVLSTGRWGTGSVPRAHALILGADGACEILSRDRSQEPAPVEAAAADLTALDASALSESPLYAVEPAGAVLRAGLLAQLAHRIHGQLIAERIAYLLTEDPSELGTAGTAYRITEVLPLHPKKLKAWVKRAGVTELTIKKRGVDLDPAALRAQLLAGAKTKGRPRNPATLILTPTGTGRCALVVVPAER